MFIFGAAMIAAVMSCPEMKAQDWADFKAYSQANSEVVSKPAAVFMGDSITEGWGRQDGGFFSDNDFLCRGISGQTTSQMLVRFRRDVLDLSPKYVVIMAGTNDIAQNNGIISLENIVGNIISMCELAKLHKIKVILCSITPADRYWWRKEVEPAAAIMEVNGMLRDYAKSARIPYVDFHSVLADNGGGLPEKYAPDGVHPNLECYKIMESVLLPYIR